ncbi:unnamed protein product [Bursaphelenchus okinawaensis]|uniref:Uncharacterized protein n=1 Tax=Bursaphelenchus okinawaensis TaxID=465554 RepID=A0A811JW95_9BILA|nr:unnamed protein product [Bursaphelenchus okinawaensis]CAG9085461.1 unnamed protein product [Bursaphelenchus okinawaensis]
MNIVGIVNDDGFVITDELIKRTKNLDNDVSENRACQMNEGDRTLNWRCRMVRIETKYYNKVCEFLTFAETHDFVDWGYYTQFTPLCVICVVNVDKPTDVKNFHELEEVFKHMDMINRILAVRGHYKPDKHKNIESFCAERGIGFVLVDPNEESLAEAEEFSEKSSYDRVFELLELTEWGESVPDGHLKQHLKFKNSALYPRFENVHVTEMMRLFGRTEVKISSLQLEEEFEPMQAHAQQRLQKIYHVAMEVKRRRAAVNPQLINEKIRMIEQQRLNAEAANPPQPKVENPKQKPRKKSLKEQLKDPEVKRKVEAANKKCSEKLKQIEAERVQNRGLNYQEECSPYCKCDKLHENKKGKKVETQGQEGHANSIKSSGVHEDKASEDEYNGTWKAESSRCGTMKKNEVCGTVKTEDTSCSTVKSGKAFGTEEPKTSFCTKEASKDSCCRTEKSETLFSISKTEPSGNESPSTKPAQAEFKRNSNNIKNNEKPDQHVIIPMDEIEQNLIFDQNLQIHQKSEFDIKFKFDQGSQPNDITGNLNTDEATDSSEPHHSEYSCEESIRPCSTSSSLTKLPGYKNVINSSRIASEESMKVPLLAYDTFSNIQALASEHDYRPSGIKSDEEEGEEVEGQENEADVNGEKAQDPQVSKKTEQNRKKKMKKRAKKQNNEENQFEQVFDTLQKENPGELKGKTMEDCLEEWKNVANLPIQEKVVVAANLVNNCMESTKETKKNK